MRQLALDRSALSPREYDAYAETLHLFEEWSNRNHLSIMSIYDWLSSAWDLDSSARSEILACFPIASLGVTLDRQSSPERTLLVLLRLASHTLSSKHLTRDHTFIQTSPLSFDTGRLSSSSSTPDRLPELTTTTTGPSWSSSNPFRNRTASSNELESMKASSPTTLARAASISTLTAPSPPIPPRRPATSSTMSTKSSPPSSISSYPRQTSTKPRQVTPTAPPPPPPLPLSRRPNPSPTSIETPHLAIISSSSPFPSRRSSAVPSSISSNPSILNFPFGNLMGGGNEGTTTPYQIPMRSGSGSWQPGKNNPSPTGYQSPQHTATNDFPDPSSYRPSNAGVGGGGGGGLSRSKTVGSKPTAPFPPPPKRSSISSVSSDVNPFASTPVHHPVYRATSLSIRSTPPSSASLHRSPNQSSSPSSITPSSGRKRELKEVLVQGGKDLSNLITSRLSGGPSKGDRAALFAKETEEDEDSSGDDEGDEEAREQRERRIHVEREMAREGEIGWSQL